MFNTGRLSWVKHNTNKVHLPLIGWAILLISCYLLEGKKIRILWYGLQIWMKEELFNKNTFFLLSFKNFVQNWSRILKRLTYITIWKSCQTSIVNLNSKFFRAFLTLGHKKQILYSYCYFFNSVELAFQTQI